MSDYSFKPSLRAWLLFVAVFPLFMALGFWQLQRGEEKSAINALREVRSQDAAIRLGADAPEDIDALRYRIVQVEGEYDTAHQFLIDNQLQGQAVGYHVLTPLRLAETGKAVLVNRGWVPLCASRAILPDTGGAPSGRVRVQGALDRMHRVGFRLKGAEIPGAGWPSVVQAPEPGPLSVRLGYPLLPYQVLLDPAAEGGYVRAWRAAKLDPDKNRGYALQWFLFAACAAVFFVRHGFKKRRPPWISSHD
jgi:surfeit locus 1 family protein